MPSFYESREWLMGDESQQRYARMKAERGVCSIPVYGMDNVDSRTKAPVMFVTGERIMVVPDLLLMKDGRCQWHEVKAKSRPTWRRLNPGPRWEHGCDYSLATEYRDIQDESGGIVFIVVHETMSPVDDFSESKLIQSDLWLVISISEAFRHGDHRQRWPNPSIGDFGRRGKGGLLWPRSAMKQAFEESSCR